MENKITLAGRPSLWKWGISFASIRPASKKIKRKEVSAEADV